MRMNAGLILAGQQPDFVNVLDRSNRAAAFQGEAQHQNALREVYKNHGAGIIAGDQNALNALAAYDPRAALSTKHDIAGQGRADAQLDIQRQNLGMRQKEFEFRIQEHARQIGAQESAALAAQIKQGVMAGTAAQTPEQWDEIVTQFGATDLVGQFENREALLRQYMTAAQILEREAGPKDPAGVQTLKFRAQEAGLQPGTPEYAEFMARNGKPEDGMRITAGPDGGLVVEQGSAVTSGPPKMTVDAAKNTGFLARTREANKVLNELEAQGTRLGQQALGAVPGGLGNYGRDPDFQRFDQARRDFVNAILRRESGAVISDQEFDNADKQYFPVPGDSPEVIAQKRKNRETAILGLEVGSGGGAQYLDQITPAEPQQDLESMPAPEGIDPVIWQHMPPEDRALWNE